MALLDRLQKFGKYTVLHNITENQYAETYVVEDEQTKYFLKMFSMKRIPEKLVDVTTKEVREILYSEKLKHKNINSFLESGTYDSDDGPYHYYLTKYINGDLVAGKLQTDGPMTEEEALRIYRQLMDGLKYMHDQGVMHNDITPRNIFINSFTNEAEIIDLGHVSPACAGTVPFETSDLDMLYSANESFAGIYDEQTDIFSATAVLYTMLTNEKPWKMDFQDSMGRGRRAMLLKEKRKAEPIAFSELKFEERTKVILAKGLALTQAERYKNIDEVFTDMDAQETPHVSEPHPNNTSEQRGQSHHDRQDRAAESPNKVDFEIKRGTGNGFKDIAGMQELKDYLTQRVIFVIKNKEKAEKYRLSTPNGMLLYGPPGCGKSFVAEKFAEETGFNYIFVKSSDLASSFVHGSQEKISQLFDQAGKNAPVVICFDEFDALVPDRSNPAAQYSAGEVNEFLTQLNNCAHRGIFVVGTTNRPDKIDPAVLRTGRIDKQVYVPLPDKEARKEMFLLHLKGRPYDESAIDADKLSEMSEGYIASDIAYVVNDAAMIAAFTDKEITEELLEASVKNTHPSLRPDTMQIYEDIKRKMENTERSNMTRPKIGFR